jgi:hypothetical protein
MRISPAIGAPASGDGGISLGGMPASKIGAGVPLDGNNSDEDDDVSDTEDEVRSTKQIEAAKCLLDDVFVLRAPKKDGPDAAPVLAFADYLRGEHSGGRGNVRSRHSNRLPKSLLEQKLSVSPRELVLRLADDLRGPKPSVKVLRNRMDSEGAILLHLPGHSALVHVESLTRGITDKRR